MDYVNVLLLHVPVKGMNVTTQKLSTGFFQTLAENILEILNGVVKPFTVLEI